MRLVPVLRPCLGLLAALALLVCPGAVQAWGVEGHQVIALLAQQQLTPTARHEVERLLALEPGSTLASVASWADEHRTLQTMTWHYVNFPPGDCHYVPERDCPGGQCVVAALEREEALLRSAPTDPERLTALKYVVHFAGDLHQPLHAGYLEDRGGNDYALRYLLRRSNLHAFWDSGMIRLLGEDADTLAQRLAASPVDAAALHNWSPAEVAQESCRLVAAPGFYPPHLADADYVRRYTPVLESRLRLAGARLAELLNRLLG